MAFKSEKDKLLKVLRSEITTPELKTGHGNFSLFGIGSNGEDSPIVTSDSDEEVVVHTHESMLASLAKQLEIQKEVTEICERDLAYRTEIIELLSARIIQLEAESETWKEQRKSFAALREKMVYLEQLYGGDGARELEQATHIDGPVIPEDQTLVEITYLETLKSQVDKSRVDMQNWTIRISELESQLEEVREESSASRVAYVRLDEEKRECDRNYESRISSLQAELDTLREAGAKASARIEELSGALERADEHMDALTVELKSAEATRDASLAAASAEAADFATLKGRIAEFEAQHAIWEQQRAEYMTSLGSSSKRLADSEAAFSTASSRIKELEVELDASKAEISSLLQAHKEASERFEEIRAGLETKLMTSVETSQSEIATLQAALHQAEMAKADADQELSKLQAAVSSHEEEVAGYTTLIQELRDSSDGLNQRVGELQAELEQAKQTLVELEATNASSEAAAEEKYTRLHAEEAAAKASAEAQVRELETQIIYIKEQCSHHTSELEQAKLQLEELGAAQGKAAEAAQRITELEDLLSSRESRVNELEAELGDIKERVQDYERRQQEATDALEVAKKEYAASLAEYDGRLSDMTLGASTNASRHAALENEVSSLTAKVAALEGDLEASKLSEEQLKKDLEEHIEALGRDDVQKLNEAESRVASLSQSLAMAEEENQTYQSRIVELEQSVATTESEVTKRFELQLQDAETKITNLQLAFEHKSSAHAEAQEKCSKLESNLEEKTAAQIALEQQLSELQKQFDDKMRSLEQQLGLKVLSVTELEEIIETLKTEKAAVEKRARLDVEELRSQMAAISEQSESTELQTALDKAKADIVQRDKEIAMLKKEAKEEGRRSSIDESSLQDLYAEHERQISQMEQDYDDLRIERDEIIAERDAIEAEKDAHQARCHDLEHRIKELESKHGYSMTSPVEMTDQERATLVELQIKLRETEQKLQKTERALVRRSNSAESNVSERSRDSLIIVETVDEKGNSEVREVRNIGSDAGSDTASDVTADRSTLAASYSLASTTSSVAELEAANARAEQAEREVRRLSLLLQSHQPSSSSVKSQGSSSSQQSQQSPHVDEHGSLFRRLSRHDSKSSHSSHSSMSIAAALSGASRMVGSIGHGDAPGIFPERIRRVSSHSSHHDDEHHEKHHHDISNPFLLFAGRDRKDSTKSRRSVSVSSLPPSVASPTTPDTPQGSRLRESMRGAESPISPTKSMAAIERERKAREKAERLEKERQEKAAKIEAAKAEKAAKREAERLERERKEKERRERLKADPNGLARLTAMRQGAGTYYST